MTPWQKKAFIIAEAGVNHGGSMDVARKLVETAVAAGCDAVKFQSFRANALASPSAERAEYQKINVGGNESQFEMLKRLELSFEQQAELKDYANKLGIIFFSTAFDFESMDFLGRLDIPIWKIPSGEITNYLYLKRVGMLGKPIVLSTGMATLAEVDDALRVLLESGAKRDQICILHCNTEYPTPFEDVNLRAMVNMGRAFGTAYGYSDHTLGMEVPVAAIALGARIIEKHFTLDRNMTGPDHRASLEPADLKAMMRAIRGVEQSLGDGVKRPTASEIGNRFVARKSIVAARAIRAGEILGPDNLTVKRPGTGISAMRWDEVISRRAPRDFAPDEQIEL